MAEYLAAVSPEEARPRLRRRPRYLPMVVTAADQAWLAECHQEGLEAKERQMDRPPRCHALLPLDDLRGCVGNAGGSRVGHRWRLLSSNARHKTHRTACRMSSERSSQRVPASIIGLTVAPVVTVVRDACIGINQNAGIGGPDAVTLLVAAPVERSCAPFRRANAQLVDRRA